MTRKTAEQRRPSREAAEKAIADHLEELYGEVPDFSLHPDGDADSAEGKCGWQFWIRHQDTTSYVHEDLEIEWYGTGWEPGMVQDDDGEYAHPPSP